MFRITLSPSLRIDAQTIPTPPATIIGICSASKPAGSPAAPVVQLADRLDRHARRLKRVPPTGDLSRIGHRVVPEAKPVNVAPGGEARTGRHANRRRGICVREPHAPRRQRVQVGGVHERVPGTAERAGLMARRT